MVSGIQRQRENFSWRFAAILPAQIPGDRLRFPRGFGGTRTDWAKRTANLDSLLHQLHKEGLDSRSMFGKIDPITNQTVWSPERLAQHQDILKEVLQEMEHIPRQRKGVLMAGLGGSGKTSVRQNDWAKIPLEDYADLSADIIKEKMSARGMIPDHRHDPRLKGYSPMELSGLTHMESNEIAQQVAKAAMQQGTNVVWDYRMGNLQSALDRISDLNDHDYNDLGAFLVHVTPQTAQDRAINRHLGGQEKLYQGQEQGGGRWFPTWAMGENAPTPGSGHQSSSQEAFNQLVQNHSHLLPMGWGAVDNNEDPIILGGSGQWGDFEQMKGTKVPSAARQQALADKQVQIPQPPQGLGTK